MTLFLNDNEASGYEDFKRQLAADGVTFADLPLNDAAPSGGTLPPEKILKRLASDSYREYLSSDSTRKEPIALIETYWRRWNLQPYSDDELLLAEQVNVTTPLIRSRVYQAHGSLYSSLALTPFYGASVDTGEDGALATHAELAFDEQMRAADHDNSFDQALKGSLVGTLGILKGGVQVDEQGAPRLDVEAVDLRDLFLSPHNVRDLQQCTMIAQRYYETAGWVKDQALAGLFDRKAAAKITPTLARDLTDGGAAERDLHALPASDGLGFSDESKMVELLEVYIRVRPTPEEQTEVWRMVVARTGWVVLRAEPWDDGFPFWPIRHERGTNTIYAPSFASILKDLQYGKDMLFSLSFEQNRMSVAPFVEYDELSPTAAWIAQRQVDNGGKAPRILPGDLIPTSRGSTPLKFTYHPPANMAVSAMNNEIEAMAGTATIPMLPMQTYRSATEHRFAQASVTSKEQQMLKVLRGDLSRFVEYMKRLWIKYVVEDAPGGGVYIRHGGQLYHTTEEALLSLRFEPRGMTTQADQMQVAAASGEAFQIAMTLAAQKPMLMQAGAWPQIYEAARLRLEALGFREVLKVLGPPPVQDPNVTYLDPKQAEASMMLMQAQAGQAPMMGMGQQQAGPDLRASDAAPTVAPGGNPPAPDAAGVMTL